MPVAITTSDRAKKPWLNMGCSCLGADESYLHLPSSQVRATGNTRRIVTNATSRATPAAETNAPDLASSSISDANANRSSQGSDNYFLSQVRSINSRKLAAFARSALELAVKVEKRFTFFLMLSPQSMYILEVVFPFSSLHAQYFV